MKQRRFFDHRNYIEESTSKQHQFFDHRNHIEESMPKRRRFFAPHKYIEEVCRNDVEIYQYFLFDIST